MDEDEKFQEPKRAKRRRILEKLVQRFYKESLESNNYWIYDCGNRYSAYGGYSYTDPEDNKQFLLRQAKKMVDHPCKPCRYFGNPRKKKGYTSGVYVYTLQERRMHEDFMQQLTDLYMEEDDE
jgi:hypothetical protein